jgi:hypothetical protein
MNRVAMCDCRVEIPKNSFFCTRSQTPDDVIQYDDEMADPFVIQRR